ncbi:tail fiber protein [Escherichia phage ECP2304]|nr:tail fiber protein [Escherichia phage ECP2304]
MATRLYGILTDGLNKPIVNATVALLAKGNTITVLNGSEAVFRTDGEGAYNITVQAGHYKVIIGPQGLEPYKAGEIVIYSDSPEGSLNGYLINWAPEELTPDVIKQVQQLVANSEEYALQAGRSAAAANADATDARNSKASAAQSASDALVYKNDAKASEDAAKQAQAGAAGSANTASQAVTTIQGLKSNVEQLKADTQDIKDSAVRETQAIKDAAVFETTTLKDAAAASAAQASNNATEAGQQAGNAAGSAQSASTDAGRAEVAAGKAEGIIGKSLLKENNLSDLTDRNFARGQLAIDLHVQDGTYTFLYSQNKLYRLVVGSEGTCQFQKFVPDQGWLTFPLPIIAGGTNSTNAEGARINLDVPSKNEAFLVENNLSEIKDKETAWVNIRPDGPTPLAANPVKALDAVTLQWLVDYINDGTSNKSWTVLNEDSITPSSGTNVRGGILKSEYKSGTNIRYQAYLQSYGKIDGLSSESGAVLSNGVQEWAFGQDGTLRLPNAESQIGTLRSDGAIQVDAYVRAKDFVAQPLNSVGVAAIERNAIRMINYANVGEGYFVNTISGDWYDGSWILGGIRSGSTWLDRMQLNVYDGRGGSASYLFGTDGIAKCQEWRSLSDKRIKSNIERINDPLSKMRNIKGVKWTLETNGSVGYGFIAQDVEKDFPEAVSETKSSPVTLRNGSSVSDVKSVNTSGIAAALHHEAILALMQKVENLEAELAALKEANGSQQTNLP